MTASRRRLFVHIGVEKTGTSTLQRFLHRNSDRLEEAGFSYMNRASASYYGRTSHSPVPGALAARPDFVPADKARQLGQALAELKRDLEEEPRDAIISAEHLHSRLRNPEQLEALKQAFGDRQVIIVCYVRRQDSMGLASYSTAVRSGEYRPFDQAAIRPSSPYYNHLATIDYWASAFGQDAMKVRVYDRAVLLNGDIRDDFAELLGLPAISGWQRDSDDNPSLDALQLALLRRINRFLPRYGKAPRWYVEAGRWFRSRCVVPYLPKGRPLTWLLRDTAPDEILARFADSNTELERRYLSPGALAKWMPGTRDGPAGAAQDAGTQVPQAASR